MQQKQSLGLFSLTMIVISLVIGMGIFKTPATIAAKAGTEAIFYAAWLLGGFIALCGALTYAEIGLRLPVTGGYYKVFAHAYHPAVGFTINALILISNAASLAVVALIGADYAADFWFGKEAGTVFNITIAIVPIILFYLVNLLGLPTSSKTQNILTVIKISLVVLLIASVTRDIQIEPHGYNSTAQTYQFNGSNGALLLMLSLVAVSFTYGGYQQTINFGGEVSNAKTLQRGIVMGILIVIILYLSIAWAYVQVIGFDKMKNASAIGALLCEVWFGKAGGKVFDVAMFLSVMAYVNVLLMSNPRVMYAMSADGVFPKIFTSRHAKTQVLVPGLTLFAVIAIVVTFFGKEVDDVLSFSIFLDCFGMGLSAATLLILRKRNQGNENITKGFVHSITPLLCVLFVLAYVVVGAAVIIDKPMAALTGIILMVFFLVVYFLLYHNKNNTLGQ